MELNMTEILFNGLETDIELVHHVWCRIGKEISYMLAEIIINY